MGTARQAGIPVPDVVGAGLLDEVPFLVLRYCEPAIDGMVGPWAWLSPNDPLLRDGGYPATQQPALRALLVDLQAEPFEIGRAHV